MDSRRALTVFPLLALLAVTLATPAPAVAADEPDLVVVQHLLVGFKRSLPRKNLTRTKKEAAALAAKLLQRAEAGEDFDALVKEYTNDSHPGIYRLTNRKAPLRADARKRDDMVPGFGEVAFRLDVGEVGMAKYSAGGSPYGWHIIKRLE